MGVSGGVLLLLFNLLIVNLRWLRYIWWSIRFFNSDVRISVSYLYRIKVNDGYLLIKGKRIRNQYQPVGGVYKRHESSSSYFTSIGALDDDLFPIDKSSKNDLRIRIKGRYLLSFIKWFESGVNRETCPWREFYEELVSSKILSYKNFPYLFFEVRRRYIHGIEWSDYTQYNELFIADIIDPIFNEEQKNEIAALERIANKNILFATEENIRRLGVIPKEQVEANISRTASWLL